MPKIKVHEKALAHLSRGLYRSPASAIRELVSNAWDANATTIRIDTSYPNFLQLSVQDDGAGFTKQAFDSLMGGGIGNSEKRTGTTPLVHNRPVIGRLGIGMLGIAQLTGGFTITSRTTSGATFRARVHLYDLIKRKLDVDDETIVVGDEVNIGKYEFEEVDSATVPRGTTIIADDIHPEFARSFTETLPTEKVRLPSLDWKECIKTVSKVHSLQELGDYWRFLWELSASCPIPYVNHSALPHNLVKEDQDRLLSYKFRVIVDGRELFKPVHLKGNLGGYTVHRIQPERLRVYGRHVNLHGYIAVQEGSQLHPDELRGVLIRINNVAIGYYDPSMLDYRTNEGPRSRWLTGEVFVEEGLEDALNIDRDSFNRVHPEFRAVQKHVHAALKGVFSEVWKNIDVRSDARTKDKEKLRKAHLSRVISDAVDAPVIVKTAAKVEDDPEPPKATLSDEKGKLQVQLPEPETLGTKKTNRQLAASLMALFEVAMLEKTAEKRKERFSQLVLDLLSKW